MNKKLKTYSTKIIIAFVIKSILYFLGKSEWSSEKMQWLLGNKVLPEIGDQLVALVCILIILDAAGEILYRIINKLHMFYLKPEDRITENDLQHYIHFESIGRAQSNVFLLSSLATFVLGIALIGGGAVFTYYKMKDFASILMFAAGIVSEIAAICAGFLYHTVLKQITDIHKLSKKEGQIRFLIQEAEKLDHKEEMMTEILENVLNFCMDDK